MLFGDMGFVVEVITHLKFPCCSPSRPPRLVANVVDITIAPSVGSSDQDGIAHYAEDWWKTIQKTAKEELAPEMGVAYRGVVLFCLEVKILRTNRKS